MPWQEVTPMSGRQEFVRLAVAEGANKRALCRHFNISPKTGYKWIGRALERDESFSDLSRRPHHSPNRTDPELEGLIPVSYTHLRAHETDSYLVCRLLLEKK